MPLTVRFPQKTVVLSKGTRAIIQAYQDALREVFHKDLTVDDEATLALDESRDRPEWWCKFAALLNRVVVDLVDLKEKKLLPFAVTMDLPASELRQEYIAYLNKIITQERTSFMPFGSHPSQLTEKERILDDDLDLLIYHIFSRIVTIALSDDMSPTRDGDHLIAVLRGFIQRIQSGRLLVKGRKEAELTVFEKHLAAENHSNWIISISSMISILKELHANRAAVNDTMNYLNDLQFHLKVSIILILNPDQKPTSTLGPDWIDDTLSNCVERYLGRSSSSSSDLSISRSENAALFSAVVKRKGEDSAQKIETLYRLFFRTRLLITTVGKLDVLRILAGWIPIMTGVLNFDELARSLDQHGEECGKVLTIADANDKMLSTSAAKGLMRFKPFAGTRIHLSSHQSSDALRKLMDPARLSRMAHYMMDSFGGVIGAQETLGISIVNTVLLNRFIPATVAYESVLVITPPLSEPLSIAVSSAVEAASSSTQTVVVEEVVSPAASSDRRLALPNKVVLALPGQKRETVFKASHWSNSVFSALPYNEEQIIADLSKPEMVEKIAQDLLISLLEKSNSLKSKLFRQSNPSIKTLDRHAEEFGEYFPLVAELEIAARFNDAPEKKFTQEYHALLEQKLRERGLVNQIEQLSAKLALLEAHRKNLLVQLQAQVTQKLYFSRLIDQPWRNGKGKESQADIDELLYEMLAWHAQARGHNLYVFRQNETETKSDDEKLIFQYVHEKPSEIYSGRESVYLVKMGDLYGRLQDPHVEIPKEVGNLFFVRELERTFSGPSNASTANAILPFESLLGENNYVASEVAELESERQKPALMENIIHSLIEVFLKTVLPNGDQIWTGMEAELKKIESLTSTFLGKILGDNPEVKTVISYEAFIGKAKAKFRDNGWQGLSDSLEHTRDFTRPHTALFHLNVLPVLAKIQASFSLLRKNDGQELKAKLITALTSLLSDYYAAKQERVALEQKIQLTAQEAREDYQAIDYGQRQGYLEEPVSQKHLAEFSGLNSAGGAALHLAQLPGTLAFALRQSQSLVPLAAQQTISPAVLSAVRSGFFHALDTGLGGESLNEASRALWCLVTAMRLTQQPDRLLWINRLSRDVQASIAENPNVGIPGRQDFLNRFFSVLRDHPDRTRLEVSLSHEAWGRSYLRTVTGVRRYRFQPSVVQYAEERLIGHANRVWVREQADFLRSLQGFGPQVFGMALLVFLQEAETRARLTPGLALSLLGLSRSVIRALQNYPSEVRYASGRSDTIQPQGAEASSSSAPSRARR